MSEIELKVVFVGDTQVGKSSLIHRYVDNTFTEGQTPTFGAMYHEKTIKLGQKSFEVYIWDTAGQERLKSIANLYYKDAQIMFIVYDVTDGNSIEGLGYWIKEVNEKISNEFVTVLVGNKCDLVEDLSVDARVARIQQEHGWPHFFTSAKTGKNVEEIFRKGLEAADEEGVVRSVERMRRETLPRFGEEQGRGKCKC